MDEELRYRFDELTLRLEAIAEAEAEEREKLWLAYKGVAGIEGLTTGLAYIAELVQPLRQLVPPSTAQPLPEGVGTAVENIRLTLETPTLRFEGRLPVPDWEGPIIHIGQPLPPSQQNTNPTYVLGGAVQPGMPAGQSGAVRTPARGSRTNPSRGRKSK